MNLLTLLSEQPHEQNSSVIQSNNLTQINLIRTEILISSRFRKWRKHIQKQLKTIQQNERLI